MKQTKTTITFLSAQYRAVLKDAYLKGLASTALLSTAAMASVYASSAEAASNLDNLEQLGTAGDYTLDSTGGSKDLRVNKDLNWQGNLTVNSSVKGDPHKIISNVQGADINGTGSLTVEGSGAVLAVGEPQGNYEFKMDLGKIDVKNGEIRVRSGFHQAGNTQVSADEINVGGSAGGEAVIHVAGMGDNGSVAALGRTEGNGKKASVINLQSGGRILLNGKKAENAVLQGEIKGNGGTISFAENSGQQGFYNNGTIKATGQLENTTIKVGGGSTAVFDFDKALNTVPGSDAHLKLNSGTLEIKGAPAQANTGRVEIHNGTLELGANAKISNNHEQNALITIGGGDEDQEGRLKVTWGHVNDFVNAKNGNHHGTIEIRKDGVLEMANANKSDVHLNNFDFNDKRYMGQIQVQDGGTVAADTLKVDRALKTGSGASAGWSTGDSLDLRADTLKLKESGDANVDYQFRKAVTKNLQLEASKGWKDTFNLKNDVRILNSEKVADSTAPDSGQHYEAGTTSFNSTIKIDSGGRLDVAAGTLTTKGKVNLGLGSMNVGGQDPDFSDTLKDRSKGVDATWKAEGGLHLSNDRASNITIKGTGEQTVGADANGNGGKVYQGKAVLDLTAGQLTVNGSNANKTTFDVQDGELRLSSANAAQLLNTAGGRKGASASGAAVHLGGNASMIIEGDLKGAAANGKQQGLATDTFQQVADASGVASDKVGLSGTGNVVQATNMHLKGNELNPGEGNSFVARQKMTLDKGAQGNNEFAVKSGKIVLGSGLDSTNGITDLNVGDGTSAADLELGYASLKTDRYGQLTAEGEAGQLADKSAAAGTVGMDIKLDGVSADKLAALRAKYGKWTAKNIDASKHALIEIGSERADGQTAATEYGADAPSLDAATVTLADGSKITVHEQGALDFDKLDMKGGAVTSQGAMNFDELLMSGGTIDSSENITAGKIDMTGGTVTAAKDLEAGAYGTSSLKGGAVNVAGNASFGNDLNVGGGNLTARKNVTIDGNLDINSGSVTAVGTLENKGNITQNGGVVSAGTVNVSGDYTMDGGALGGGGSVTIAGDMNVTSGGVTVNKDLTADNIDWSGGEFNVKGNTVSSGKYKVDGKALVKVSGDGVSSGDYIMTGGAASYGGSLTVGKNLDVSAGVLTSGKDIKVSGDSTVGKVTVSASGDFITAGHVSVSGGTINAGKNFQYDTMKLTGGKVSAGGNVSGNNFTISGGTLAGSGDFTVGSATINGGTVTAGGTYTGDDITMTDGSLISTGNMTVDHTMISGGSVTAGGSYSGGDLTMDGGTLSSSGDMTVDNSVISSGTVTAGGHFSGADLTMTGGALNGKGDVIVDETDISGGAVTAGGKFSGANVYVDNKGSISTSGDFTAAGELYVDDGTVSAGGNLTADEVFLASGGISSKGNLTSNSYTQIKGGKVNVDGNLTSHDNMTVEGTSEVKVSGAGLVEGDLLIKGGNSAFDAALAVAEKLNVTGGSVSSKGNMSAAQMDLTSGTVSAGDFTTPGNANIAGSNFNVTNSANIGGNLNVTGGESTIGNRLDVLGMAQLDGGKLSAGGAMTAGNMHVNGAEVAVGNGLMTDKLHVSSGSLTVSGTATVGPLDIDGGSMTVNGQLNASNVDITGGELSTSGSMATDRLTMGGGTINIGNLKGPDGAIVGSGDLSVKDFAMSGGALNIVESKMTAGKAPIGTSAGDKLNFGFTTTGGDINISGATAKLELGIEALRDLVFNHDLSGNNGNEHPDGSTGSGPIDPKDKYLNNITLSDGATIKFNFDDKTYLTKEDIKKLKEEFLKNPDDVPDGNIDIGDALLEGLEDVFLPNGDVDWQKLKIFIASMGLDGVKIDRLDEARLVNIKDGEKVIAHVGSMRVDGDEVMVGNGSLNNAAGNGGNFIVDTTNNDALIDVTLDSGASFQFNNGGNLKDIILKAGKESDKTNVVIGGNSSTATNINKIQGLGDYTNVFIEALTKIADGIDSVDRLSVKGETSIGKNLTNIDSLEVGSKLDVTGNLEQVKDITIASGDVTVNGSITETETIKAVSGSLSVNSALDKLKEILAQSSDISVGGGISNVDKLQLTSGSNLTTSGSGLQSIKEITLAASKAIVDGNISSSDSLTLLSGSELSASGSLENIKDIALSASKATIGGDINGITGTGGSTGGGTGGGTATSGSTSLAVVSGSELNVTGALNNLKNITFESSKGNIGGVISGSQSLALTNGSELKTQAGINEVKEIVLAGSAANVGGGITKSDSLTMASGSELTTAEAIAEVKKIFASASTINAGKGISNADSVTALDGSTLTATSGGLSNIKEIGIRDSTANIGGDINTSDKLVALNSTVNVNGKIDAVKDIGLSNTKATVTGGISNADKLTVVKSGSLTTTGGLDSIKQIAFDHGSASLGGDITNSGIVQLTSGSTINSTGGMDKVDQIVVMASNTDLQGTVQNAQTIEIGSGSAFKVGKLGTNDTLIAQDSTVEVTGDIDGVKKYYASNTTTNTGGNVFNFDKVLVQGGQLNVSGSIASGAELNMASDSKLTVAQNIDGVDNAYLGGAAEIAGNIQNGQQVTVGGDGKVNVAGKVTAMDTVQVASGNLKVGSIDGVTQVSVAQGGTLEVSGDTDNIEYLRANGKITVAGTLKANNMIGTVSGGTGQLPGASIEAGNLDITAPVDTLMTEYSGDIKVTGRANFGNQAILSGNNNFGTVHFARGVQLAKGRTQAHQLELAQGADARVGSDGKGGSAQLHARYASLNGGTIIADPEYGEKATIVAMNNMGIDPSAPGTGTSPDAGVGTDPAPDGGSGTLPEGGGSADGTVPEIGGSTAALAANGVAGGNAGGAAAPGGSGQYGSSSLHGAPAKVAAAAVTRAGELNGTLVALRNSVVAMGTSAEDVDSAVKEIQTAMAPYFKDGSLQNPAEHKNGVGAAAYVGRPVILSSGSKIVVDANRDYEQYQGADASYKGLIAAHDIYLDSNSALVLTNDATQGTESAAISFRKPDASMYAKKGAKLLIAGTTINPNAPIKVFRDTNGKIELITEDGKALDAQSVNGLFEAPDGFGPGQVDDLIFKVNQTVADKSFTDVTQPVRDALAQYGNFDNNPARPPLHGDLATGVTYNPDTNQFTDGSGNVLTANKFVPVKNADGSYSVYHAADNPLLNYIITATNSGRDAEAVARMASLGGVARASLAASEATTDAIAARSGVGNAGADERYTSKPAQAVPWMNDKRNEKMAYSRGSVWAAPAYKKVESSGLSADNKQYGNDIELNGLTAGMDIRVHKDVEVGAAISAGNIDGSSSGLVSGVSNDGKYLGAAAYARYTRGPSSVIADLTWTETDNNLSADTAIGKAETSVNATVISAGVTARQEIKAGPVEITPHAGLRLTRLETSAHDVNINGSTVARADKSTANMVSLPVGVTVARNIKQGTWSIKPSLDLTLTANAGDKSTGTDVKWQGINNMTTSLDSQVVDDVTASVKAGVTVRNGRFAAAAGVAYRTSDTTDDLAIEANARYDY